MSRKKKNDDIFEHPFPTIESETIDITRLEDDMRRTIYTRPPYTITTTGTSDSDHFIVEPRYFGTRNILTGGIDTTTISGDFQSLSSVMDWEEYAKTVGKKEEAGVKMISRKSIDRQEHIVLCNEVLDLLPEKVLTTLSAIKGRLMFEIAPIHIKEIQCKMTPHVKNNIIEASKRLKMYGKKSPIIPSFDEYGNRLPDQIEIGDSKGIIIKIVDSKEYGDLYFELKAIEFSTANYSPTDWKFWSPCEEDVPF